MEFLCALSNDSLTLWRPLPGGGGPALGPGPPGPIPGPPGPLAGPLTNYQQLSCFYLVDHDGDNSQCCNAVSY